MGIVLGKLVSVIILLMKNTANGVQQRLHKRTEDTPSDNSKINLEREEEVQSRDLPDEVWLEILKIITAGQSPEPDPVCDKIRFFKQISRGHHKLAKKYCSLFPLFHPLSNDRICSYLAKQGDLVGLERALELNYPLSEDCCEMAVQNNNLALLQWLHEHGAQLNGNELQLAFHNDDLDCILYLQNRMGVKISRWDLIAFEDWNLAEKKQYNFKSEIGKAIKCQ